MENKKPKGINLGILTALVLAVGFSIYQGVDASSVKKQYEDKIALYEDSYTPVYEYFTSLTLADFEAKVASGEKMVVYVGRPDCGDCNTYEPTFEEIIKEKNLANKLYYVNVKWIRANSSKEDWQAFKDKYGFTQTPAFIHFENGNQIDMIEWTDKGLPKSELETWLAKQGLI